MVPLNEFRAFKDLKRQVYGDVLVWVDPTQARPVLESAYLAFPDDEVFTAALFERRKADGDLLGALTLVRHLQTQAEGEAQAKWVLERLECEIPPECLKDEVAFAREVSEGFPGHVEIGEAALGVLRRTGEQRSIFDALCGRLDLTTSPPPDDVPLFDELASMAELCGEWEVAIQAREWLLDEPDHRARSQSALVILYEQAGRWLELGQLLEALAESVTGSARASLLISSGDAALKGDEEPTAERRFRLAVTAAPDDSSALIRLLRLSSVLENVEDALQLFELLYEQLAGIPSLIGR